MLASGRQLGRRLLGCSGGRLGLGRLREGGGLLLGFGGQLGALLILESAAEEQSQLILHEFQLSGGGVGLGIGLGLTSGGALGLCGCNLGAVFPLE